MECLPPVKNVILGEAKTLKEETEYYLKLRRESNRILWPSSSYWKSTYIFPSELKQKKSSNYFNTYPMIPGISELQYLTMHYSGKNNKLWTKRPGF